MYMVCSKTKRDRSQNCCRHNLLKQLWRPKEREGAARLREEIEMCNCGCMLSHPIVPLFIVVGKVNYLPFRITTFNR